MILFCVCLAHARQQGLGTPVATGVALSADSIKPLKIGDTIPEVLWNMPLQMVKAGQEGSTAITLNDYRGKLIILDFWATWCSPCVAMLPKSDSLQNRYKKELQLLPVSSQTETEVLRLLNREAGVKLPSVVGDTVVKKFFPHFYLPHYVWIGADGKVKAITDHYRVTDRSVKEILGADVSGVWTAKRDKVLEFKRGETLWDAVKKGIRLPLLSEIIMTGHIDSLPGQYEIMQNADGGLYKIVMVNAPLVKLYSLALGGGEYIGNNRIRLETADSTLLMPRFKGDQLVEWARFNTYCFQASVPRADWRQAYTILYEQLNHHFPKYRVTLETVRQKVIALKTIPSFRKETLSTADGRSFSAFNAKGFELRNKPLSSLILRLNVLYQQHSPYPIVDGTGLTGNVSLKVDAKLADLNGLNRALEPHGLRFAEEERDIPMVIFRDR